MYLNDAQVSSLFAAIAEVSAPRALLLLREPIAVDERLTLVGHYSNELEHDYHAVYRSVPELLALIGPTLLAAGYRLVDQGDVYAEDALNNRAETRQCWFVLERA